MKSELKKCPCGINPTRLCIDGTPAAKYAYASGDCCGEWAVEFRNNYNAIGGNESLALASKAWNESPRPTADLHLEVINK